MWSLVPFFCAETTISTFGEELKFSLSSIATLVGFSSSIRDFPAPL